MNNDTTSGGRSLPARRFAGYALVAAAVSLALTGCQDSGSGVRESAGDGAAAGAPDSGQDSSPGQKDDGPRRLLWMGDSIGEAEAPALGAAMKAGGVDFRSVASTGGGGVVGETAAPTWDRLPKTLKSFAPDVVAYQVTTYDWGTPAEQRKAYERLAQTVNEAGAELLLVSAPPFELDDFYRPHEAEIETAPESARHVAADHPDTVGFLDASTLWGDDSGADQAQRSKDGIHSCQQGSAAFAVWFGERLKEQYGFEPADADEWATGAWTGDKVYSKLGCG
ncbi:SGNH/GDSL hydrolase family protein [Streptomyces olivaceus]|uniref:SGNH/GDSL hydrolase family protein n=1 Tax=Streptomyces olivaceus TaxID=47716 RepID=UPI0018A88047|nr:SGNH/GDSL hydrolase family protein [Streptomyces olivaceus]MBF8170714.1 SGNH/GDSL hydrolase family protein [Streptomyces olivaceus]